MKELLTDLLHMFVSFTIGSFGLMSFFGITGSFDNWTSRFIKRRKGDRSLKAFTHNQKDNHPLYNTNL